MIGQMKVDYSADVWAGYDEEFHNRINSEY